ncbi:hypothetical protein HU200_006522 [Digitaria exilis]|uniref:Cytochrome P450 n=1 Tax=Digitaria exilis TaxID=1010633 RepID=A0A835FPT1_9POAL|nr:hypothetical protein HU200_006522 [Digitaria exilis]
MQQGRRLCRLFDRHRCRACDNLVLSHVRISISRMATSVVPAGGSTTISPSKTATTCSAALVAICTIVTTSSSAVIATAITRVERGLLRATTTNEACLAIASSPVDSSSPLSTLVRSDVLHGRVHDCCIESVVFPKSRPRSPHEADLNGCTMSGGGGDLSVVEEDPAMAADHSDTLFMYSMARKRSSSDNVAEAVSSFFSGAAARGNAILHALERLCYIHQLVLGVVAAVIDAVATVVTAAAVVVAVIAAAADVVAVVAAAAAVAADVVAVVAAQSGLLPTSGDRMEHVLAWNVREVEPFDLPSLHGEAQHNSWTTPNQHGRRPTSSHPRAHARSFSSQTPRKKWSTPSGCYVRRSPSQHSSITWLTCKAAAAAPASEEDDGDYYYGSLSARAVPDMARAAGFAERSMIWLPSSDQRWKSLRGVVATHAFSPRSLAAARGVRERKVRDMVSYIRVHAGQPVDVGGAVYGGTINLVSSALFAVDVVDDVGDESAQGLRELVEELVEAIVKPNVSDLVPFLRPLDIQGWRRWTARRFHKLFHAFGRRRHGDFLGALLELMSTGKLTRGDVRAIMFDVFGAGTGTIAITVEWAMAELLRHPGIMAKVRMELESALGNTSALGNQASEDVVVLGGYAVPKGCTVIFNAWAIMRDPAAWERPEEFVPERFLDGEHETVGFRGREFKFIPFGSGRRLCPGLPMAERVVPLILASLLHAFEWRLSDGVSAEQLDVTEKFTTSNVLAVPLRAVPNVIT